MDNVKEKINSINIKRAIKATTLLLGLVLIIFISFFNATFDFANFKWGEWLANSSVLVGIMIFGIIIGNSTGTDIQQDKIGGLYQKNSLDYIDALKEIEPIKIYFSQFWLWYKERKLIEKKIDYLIENQFDGRVAKIIVKNIEKEDLVIDKLLYNIEKPNEKIYVKNDIKIKKLNQEQIDIVRKCFEFTLDTYGDSYYLSLYDDGNEKVNEAEIGKKINKKIMKDKRNAFILKITGSLIVSIAWGALTIYELASGDGEAQKRAWMNLLSRVSALFTSYLSGFSTSVVNVRDKARAIENKTDILKYFKCAYDKKEFIPETYEEMIEREFREQEHNKVVETNEENCDNNIAPNIVMEQN